MDGSETMTISGGSAQYLIHRAGLGSASAPQPDGINAPPHPFRALTANTHNHYHLQVVDATQSNNRTTLAEAAFRVDSPPPPPHGIFSRGSISAGASSTGPPPDEQPPKKKRGRPRKYGPDGKVALGLLPMPGTDGSTPGSVTPLPSKPRGRPPGSGRKQRLAAVGKWMHSSAGSAFAPHVIRVGEGEDVASKILSFSQQRPRAVCILSGCGTISLVSLKQYTSSGGTITFEGKFEILYLSGSYLVAEEGGPGSRNGGVSVSLLSPDGHVIGGSVGMLIAAGPVEVVLCSFVYGSTKAKDKQIMAADHKINEESTKCQSGDRSFPLGGEHSQSLVSSTIGIWQNSQSTMDIKHLHTGIDLTQG
ncbi:hypothetical protein SAY87_012352 [Trapa incisa]|uniref:AT-hook motif nuclear-localized protein n=1 Tax=Trapa incisa TaxID=236973 RepID=A0AAN7GNU9_9MYRT|nr:hypothetical protein SAY87_012352 [Trapa incisa]